jgi:hypothetical protein
MSPEERRQRFEERLKNASPEERARLLERMRARQAGERSDDRPPRVLIPPAGSDGRSLRSASSADAPRTIDALFGPLPTTETAGRVWRHVDGKLTPVRVRLGVTDGTNTELISGDLPEGATVVTGVLLQPPPSATQGGTRSPLMGPQRGPGQRGGSRR